MKLISCIAILCLFLLTDAGRLPDDSEFRNTDPVLDNLKPNTRKQSHRLQKRHFPAYWRDFYDRGFDQSYDSYQDDRIRELEIRVKILEQQFNTFLTKRYEPSVYVVSEGCKLNATDNSELGNRFNTNEEIEKERVWGSVDFDGNRPVSLRPVKPSRNMPKQPPVEHGTIQAEITTKAPFPSTINTCEIAILLCCDSKGDERKECLSNFDCGSLAYSKYTCSKAVLDKIKGHFETLYGPTNE